MIELETQKANQFEIFEDMAYKLFERRNIKLTRNYTSYYKNIGKNNYEENRILKEKCN